MEWFVYDGRVFEKESHIEDYVVDIKGVGNTLNNQDNGQAIANALEGNVETITKQTLLDWWKDLRKLDDEQLCNFESILDSRRWKALLKRYAQQNNYTIN